MNAALGTAGVTVGFAAALLGIAATLVGLRRRRPALIAMGGRYTSLVLGGAVLAALAMERALLTDDFSLQYVAQHHSRSTPLLFTITTMWSALEGSILLWALVLAGYLFAMVRRFRDRATDPLVAWAVVVGLAVAAFFFALMLGPANPFHTVAGAVPSDGPGPNPLLQNHPLVAFHPPLLYLGYVGFTVPFAFAMAALVTGRTGEAWLAETRRWTLFAWGCLTGGVVLGAWWSYEVLGWGGYWAWDPVENASFLPWLTGTAYLHSVLVQQRRGLLRVWNLSLLVATFALTILGTFLTRSGVLDSVHAFSDSAIGPLLLGFFAVVVAAALALIAWRGDSLSGDGEVEAPVSREGAFLANNLLFAVFAFVVLLGTVFPLLAEAIQGERLSVGRPYFDRMTMPVALALLFLMAVAPALPWQRAQPGVLRERLLWPAWAGVAVVVGCVGFGVRGLAPLVAFGLATFAGGSALRQLALSWRRNGWRALTGPSGGGMVVHVGIVVVAVAYAASTSFSSSAEARLRPGESTSIAGHTVTYLGATGPFEKGNRREIKAQVRVDGGKVYEPALSTYPFASQAIGTPSVRATIVDDVYLTLAVAPRTAGGAAVLGMHVRPLVSWLWVGGLVMLIGTALAAVPAGRRRRRDPVEADPLDERVPAGV